MVEGSVQIAAFHPDFTFGDASTSDITNYVNRSPLPMIHLLREEEVTRAVDEWDNKGGSSIWENNYDILREFEGSDELMKVVSSGILPSRILEKLKTR